MAHSYVLLLFLLVFLTSNSSSKSMAQATDQEILLTIKKDWGSPSVLSSWNSHNTSYCNWAGVTCNTNTQVIKLSFPNFNISNRIPASICSLKNLSYLDLSYNNLTDQFPTALYGCSALHFLDLSNNLFSGALPNDIDKLSSEMEHLNLSTNGFTGSLPSAIASFTKLKSLVLDSNSFNGTYPASAIGELSELETLTLASNLFEAGPIPDDFSKLKKLKTLWLSGMNLTGRIPDELSSLTELTMLALYDNKLHGVIPAWVWKLQKLELLYLYSNSFTDGIGPEVTAVSMRELDLSANLLTRPIPEGVGNMKNLTLLYLYYNNITGTIPASIGLLPSLADIRLFNNRLSGPLPPELGKHSPLGNLEVSNNFLNGSLPDTLCYNKKLYGIVVFNNSFSGELPESLGDCHTVDNIMAYNNRFTGEFPEKVWSAFPKLTTVQIQNNGFTGILPRVISPNITRIEMGNNQFSGAVPSSAPGLKNFMAENNWFSGALPADMAGLGGLNVLNLSGNMISGSIPSSIGLLGRLNSLDLSSNQISGEIPAAIGSLPVLTILDLSNNELSGEIPQELNNQGQHLSFLNLSSNKLSGELPRSLQNQGYEHSFFGNDGLCADLSLIANVRACPNRRGIRMSPGLVILLSVLAGVVVIVAVGCVAIRRQAARGQRDVASWKMTAFREVDFTERDIISNLREENVIGSGGSGKVYRVRLSGGGSAVAVKKLWSSRVKPEKKLIREFDAQVRVLGEIRHADVVNLLCYISSKDTRLLVYEFVENGSLDRWLHPAGADAAVLDWPTRLRVAIDAARGLTYMHEECARPVMHRNVKSSNIMLDPAFRAKIADFGLARILVKSGKPESVSSAGGYMAPECGRGAKVNKKVDVYSFGVVLLELVTGRAANDSEADWCLVEWAWQRYEGGGPLNDVVDVNLMPKDRNAHVGDAVGVFLLGVACTAEDAASRPSMKLVLQQLLRYDRSASSVAGGANEPAHTTSPLSLFQVAPRGRGRDAGRV